MKETYSEEEIDSISKNLGYANPIRFKGYLANFNSLREINEEELTIEDFSIVYRDVIIEELEKVKEQLGLGDDLSNLPPEEKILTIIAITKQLNINYLLKKYEGKIDEGTAKRLVEYGYTHGSCGSLGCTLCSLFESCQLKMVKAEGYAHQCVMFDGKFYDIMGCSTVEEMKDFVIREGGTQSDECVIEDFAPQSNSHKAVDYMIAKYIGEVFSLESSNLQ